MLFACISQRQINLQLKHERLTHKIYTLLISKPYGFNCLVQSIATYPSAGGRREAHECVFQERKMHGVATDVYLRKTLKKLEKVWSTNFKCERFGSYFYARGRYQYPTCLSQGMTTFSQVCKYDFKMFYLSFFYVLCFYAFLYFLSFCGRQGCFPRSYVSSIAMRKSDLCSSLRTKRWLSCFDLFPQNRF